MSLAIECGATKSLVIFIQNSDKRIRKELKLGPANFQLLSQQQLEDFLQSVKQALDNEKIYELGIGMPGIMSSKDKLTVSNTLQKVWPELKSWWIGNDVETALACLEGGSQIKVIVISGTGSNCFGVHGQSKLKIGGFGHILGDRGSGYAIAHKALRMGLREWEQKQNMEPLSSASSSSLDISQMPSKDLLISSVMSFLKFQSIPQLVSWSTTASKSEIASLAQTILQLWTSGNELAKTAVQSCLSDLAEDCSLMISKLINQKQEAGNGGILKVEIGLTGSIFSGNASAREYFQTVVEAQLKSSIPSTTLREYTILQETVHGTLKMMNMNFLEDVDIDTKATSNMDYNGNEIMDENELADYILPTYRGLPQTECRNPRSMNLHTMSIPEAIDLMLSEEEGIYPEIKKQSGNIALLVEKISGALQNGGRLFYVGAGTSGRLGILDASECPPTFRTAPEMVQGIIAGGFSSVSKAKEGAEDSIIDGMDAIKDRHVNEKDVVLGIAASGRTPFVWGGMYQAKLLGAFTSFLTFNVSLELKFQPDLVLAMDLQPEVLTGSTRLKAGSATKCILNMLSTLAMVRMGKCFENLMIDLNPANEKLRQRALRIVMLLMMASKDSIAMTPNLNEHAALEVLKRNKYDIKTTVLQLRALN